MSSSEFLTLWCVCVCLCVCELREWTREMIQRPVKNIVVVVLLSRGGGLGGVRENFDATNISESKIPKGKEKKYRKTYSFFYYDKKKNMKNFHRNFPPVKNKISICCPRETGGRFEQHKLLSLLKFTFHMKSCCCKGKWGKNFRGGVTFFFFIF